jgi:hypothetical protein
VNSKKYIIFGNVEFSSVGRRFNTGLAKVAVQCSADTFVVNQSLVLRITICGENRHLRQARNRYKQVQDNLQLDHKPTETEDENANAS